MKRRHGLCYTSGNKRYWGHMKSDFCNVVLETRKQYFIIIYTLDMTIIQRNKKKYVYISCDFNFLILFNSSQCDSKFQIVFLFSFQEYSLSHWKCSWFSYRYSINEMFMVTIEIWLSISMENYYAEKIQSITSIHTYTVKCSMWKMYNSHSAHFEFWISLNQLCQLIFFFQ